MSIAPPEFEASADAPPASPGVYLAGGLGGLVAVAAALMEQSAGGLAGLACLIPGVIGLTLRRNAMPGVFLVTLAYFLAFPTGNPFDPASSTPAGQSYFRIADFVLVGGAAAYLVCQYRLFGLTTQAVPADPAGVTGADSPAVRVVTAADDGEVTRLAVGLAAALLAGQLVWLVVTGLGVELTTFPPVEVARSETSPNSRFLLGVGVTALAGGVLGFWAWYGRAAGLRADQARLFLTDTAWRESRRELNRHEVWRAWRAAPPRPFRRPRLWNIAVGVVCGGVLTLAVVAALAWFGVIR